MEALGIEGRMRPGLFPPKQWVSHMFPLPVRTVLPREVNPKPKRRAARAAKARAKASGKAKAKANKRNEEE